MSVVLLRIDDRLIHGQIVTAWAKVLRAERLMAVNDKVAADPIQKQLLTMAAPGGMRTSILSVDQAIAALTGPETAAERVMVTVKSPADALRLIEGGVAVTGVNAGNMMFMPGKRQVTKAVSVDDQDVLAFRAIHSKGLKVEAQWLPDSAPVDLIKVVDEGGRR